MSFEKIDTAKSTITKKSPQKSASYVNVNLKLIGEKFTVHQNVPKKVTPFMSENIKKTKKTKRPRSRKKLLDEELFREYALQGLNVKQIQQKLNHTDHNFGAKMKEVLGMYPSVYITRLFNRQFTRKV